MKNKKQLSDNETRERQGILEQLQLWMEGPVIFLSFIWLGLFLVQVTRGLNEVLTAVLYVIWAIFIIDFLLRFSLAPDKLLFLKKNVLVAVSLAVPALRFLRVFAFLRFARVLSAARGVRLVSLLGTINRGMTSLKASMQRKGFGYVMVLTFIVTLLGAAGMLSFEKGYPGSKGFEDFGDALWWTSMMMTTLGSEYWPRSPEGRALGFLLALYAFAVFGYVTATIASLFIGQEARSGRGDLPGARDFEALRREIESLRKEVKGQGKG